MFLNKSTMNAEDFAKLVKVVFDVPLSCEECINPAGFSAGAQKRRDSCALRGR